MDYVISRETLFRSFMKLIATVPSIDHTIELQDLRLQHPQLSAESGNAHTCHLGQAFIICISSDAEKLRDTIASDWRDDAELGQMSADGVDHRGLLADKQVTGTVQRQAALLFWCLGRNEPHVRPGDRLADRLGISGIVLMPLHVGLHISRRHQANCVAQRLEFTRPMMRRGAGLHADQARWQLLEKGQDVATLQLPPNDHLPNSINAVDLKDRLRDIETDCRDRSHG